jgi:hypothetical protein
VGGYEIEINKNFFVAPFCELMTYRKTTNFVASSLYFSFVNQYLLGWGFHLQ